MLRFHFALRVGEVENLEDRDITFGKTDGRSCVTVHIRGSETAQCATGVHRALVVAGCALCPVPGISQRLGMKSWRPHASDRLFSSSVSISINKFLNAVGSGMRYGSRTDE